MTENREERRANYDYRCECCKTTIPAGSQYVCVTYHQARSVPVKNSKKLYHGRVYYRTEHTNIVKRYHIGCEA